jgi:hypothetical protein
MIVIYGHIREEQGIAKMNSNTSDIIASIVESPVKKSSYHRRPFGQPYHEKVFYIWYNHGKPGAKSLMRFIPADLDEWGRLPTPTLVANWISEEFVPRADLLDEQVKNQLDSLVVAEKVEMLKRHADIGLRMQNMAIDFLNENQDVLSAPAAVRLLVEGIRIERESRGIPAALDKLRDMTDEQLMDEIKNLITSSSVTLEDVDANS